MPQTQEKPSLTDQWINDSHWDWGSSAGPLYKNPPVDEIKVMSSNRILLVCSRRNLTEAREFKNQLKGLVTTVGLTEEDFPLSLATFAPVFWGDFFGVKEFLEPAAVLTKPRLMVTDGAIVDDISGARGDEVCVNRLQEISEKWGVQLRVLRGPMSFVK